MEAEKKTKKVNIAFPVELLERIDEYADDNYISRTAVVCLATNQYLMAQEMQSMFKEFTKVLKRLSESEEVSEDVMKQLDEFQKLTRMLSGDYFSPPFIDSSGE